MQDLRRYLRECLFAWQVGERMSDRLDLCRATLLFHLGNKWPSKECSEAHRYRLCLAGSKRDVWLRTISGDIFVFYEVFLSRCYEIREFDFDRAKIIVDLGANIGLTSLYIAGRAPQAQLICVEPVPANVSVLRKNLAGVPTAKVVEAAAAARSGTMAFDDDRPAWGGALSSSGRIRVRAVSIRDLLQEFVPGKRVDLLKIDIEGGEQALFSGDVSWLDQVERIVIELHPPFTFTQFGDLLRLHGFNVYNAGEHGHALPTAIRSVP